MKAPRSLIVSAMLCAAAVAAAQPTLRNPLDFELGLSATFAEFRTNHFHAGVDIRTQGTEGHAVHAVADGYVCAVRISPWGGGKMLYINHAGGYQSVYMHLSAFEGAIARAVLAEQYRTMQYAIYKEFEPDELPVRSGQVVARSGNTGGSAGPHLHLELRHHGRTLNPLLYGLPYTDAIKPTIRGIRLYPQQGAPIEVDNSNAAIVHGAFYVGVYATDAAEGSTPKNGPDRVEVYLDGALFFMYTTEGFPLDSSRMVNAIIDYDHYLATRRSYLITRGLPGAEGEWVPVRSADGIMRLAPGVHTVKVKVYDVFENCAERSIRVTVQAATATTKQDTSATAADHLLSVCYTLPATLNRKQVQVELPPYSLYANDTIAVQVLPQSGLYAPTVRLAPQCYNLPPDKWYTLGLRAAVADSHAVVVRIGGKSPVAYRTTLRNGYYTARVRDFGTFAVMADTIAPTAKAVALRGRWVKVRIADDLSGIDTYHCYLNGSWVLAEYDGKGATLVIDTQGKRSKTGNQLLVDLTDVAGNHRRYTYNID